MDDITFKLFKKREMDEIIKGRPGFELTHTTAAEPVKPFSFKDIEELHKEVETMRITNEVMAARDEYLEALAKALVEKFGFEIEVVTECREELKQVAVYYKIKGV